jgi:hypothetical protein
MKLFGELPQGISIFAHHPFGSLNLLRKVRVIDCQLYSVLRFDHVGPVSSLNAHNVRYNIMWLKNYQSKGFYSAEAVLLFALTSTHHRHIMPSPKTVFALPSLSLPSPVHAQTSG